MSVASDSIPRSTMTAAQLRRIGALQVAQKIVAPRYNEAVRVPELLEIARYVESGS